MKILRSVTQRGSTIGIAGYFTVLMPNRWFAASHLPDGLHDLHGLKHAAAEPMSEQKALKPTGDLPWQMTEVYVRDRHMMRTAVIVLGAIAITSILLLWIMHP